MDVDYVARRTSCMPWFQDKNQERFTTYAMLLKYPGLSLGPLVTIGLGFSLPTELPVHMKQDKQRSKCVSCVLLYTIPPTVR